MQSVNWWFTIKLIKTDPTDPIHKLAVLAIEAQLTPSSNGSTERSFKSIQLQHTKRLNKLKPEKLRKLVYCVNNEKFLQHFEKK